MAVDWTSLPSELVESISKKLTIYSDYIRFRAICHTWRSSIPKTPHHLPPQIPWLLLPLHPSNRSYRSTFFNLLNNRVHYLMNPSIKSSSKNRRCGSSHGWLVVLGECPNIFLENPLTGANLELPPLCSFPNVVSFNYANIGREYVIQGPDGQHYTDSLSHMRDCFIKKVVLSSSPVQNHDFTALALLNCADKLAFCKSGSKSWTFIEVASFYFEDAIYKNGSFYTMDKSGRVLVCDVHGPSPKVSIIETTRLFGGDVQYLVSAGDDLLFITRYLVFEFTDELNLARYRTVQFDVFKLDLTAMEWIKITSVGDYVLFIGENSSFSLLASDFPGCTGNCIYYTDDYSEYNCDVFGEPDLGIYNLSDGSIEPLPCYAPNPPYIGKHRPIWLSPSPT